jgi:nucleotide-binding universal stress UspA family protein
VNNLFNHILLASHGTEGALAAESMAISICNNGGKIHHLIVVPELWQGITGDDWLNNGSTRDDFCRYLEHELGKEVDAHCERVRKKAHRHELNYKHEIVLGEPKNALINCTQAITFDLIVMGTTRPKNMEGLRSRMLTADLSRLLTVPLLIVPFPQKNHHASSN